jgi:hypothetical protein
MGLFNKKINATSALTTLIIATAIILIRSGLDLFYNNTFENTLLNLFSNLGFLEFSIFIFILCILFLFVFNRLELIRHILISFPGAIHDFFVKIKIKWSLRKKVLFILSLLLIIIICWKLFQFKN